ncbi:MAG: substrate-binding domain-containing protein [Candidatus Omnitrophica bacterium]|nr:substrate-binding domain-containing protein [Candidatus Omnitrophota bacterium]
MENVNLKATQNKCPRWKEIFVELSNELETGNFNGGEHFYSLKEICKKHQVSMITAKRVTSELQEANLVRKYPCKGTFVFKDSYTLQINLFIDTDTDVPKDYIKLQIFGGIKEVVQETHSKLAIITKPSFLNNRKSSFNIIFEEALVNVPISYNKGTYVVVHSYEPKENASSVGIDYKKGVSMAMKHLFSLGHRRIGLFAGQLAAPWMIPRFEGYLKELRNKKIKLDMKLVKETDGINPEKDWLAMKQLMALKDPPTAIFASNDSRALHILDYCRNNRIKVPEQLSIVGFDNIPESGLSNPGLTTIDTRLLEIGRKSVFLLMDLINKRGKHKNVLVKPKFIIRKTTASLRKK